MSRHILLIGENVEQHADHFARHFTVHRLTDQPDKDAYLAAVGPMIEALCLSGGANPRGDAALLDKLPNLSIVATFGVGTGAAGGGGILDLDAAKARRLVGTYGPGSNAVSVADLALAFMLALSRRLIHFDRFARAGTWETTGSKGGYTTTLSGKSVGILGLGAIGARVAKRCEGFDMTIAYHQRTRRADLPYKYCVTALELAQSCQYLVVCVPDAAATRGMVDANVLAALGPEGYLINVARGAVIDEKALIEALKSGRLAGAGLDVFANEPRIPRELAALDSVVLSPHRAAFTHDSTTAMRDMMLENLLAHFDGRPVPNPIPGLGG